MSVPPLLRQFRLLFGGRRAERELDAEMREHLELLETQYREQGLDPREARRRARMEFGSQEPLRADAREARGLVRTRELTRDLLFGVRVLVRRPGFPAVALLTLGVGVGGAAAIYGATEGILLSPLPYAEPDRLVAAWQLDHASGERQEVSPANFLDWRERATAFEALTAVEPYGFDWLSPEDGPIALETGLVYEGFFDVFRAPPLFGRTFLPEENQPGRGNVAILGYGLWRSRFGGDPDIVGRVVIFDGEPYTIVGVMREDFAVPSNEVVWAPKVLQGWEERSRTSNFYAVFGRLAPGVGLGQAAADLDGVAAALAVAYPTANASIGAALTPLHDQIVGGIRSALWLLLGAVILVLVVVVASVASLQLARAVGRTPEFTLRTALGAGPGRIARHLAVENLLLGAAGALVSFLAARVMLDGIRALAPADLPRIAEIRADGDVLGFAAAVSLLAVLATGLAPVLLAANPGLQRALGPGGRGQTASPLLRRALAALVVVQVSLTFVLLVGSGLLLRSFVAVVSQPTGFRSDGVAAVTVHTWSYLDGGPARAGFARDVVERLSGMPGITAAGVASGIPLMEAIGADFAPLTLPGAPLRADQNPPLVRFTVVSPGLLDTLGIPLRSGRPFDSRDRADSLPVTLVNERFVDRYLPDREPVGRRISLGGSLATNGEPLNPEIVGVVGDVRNVALHEAPAPAVYLVHPQAPTGANAFIARGVGSADVVLSQVRRAIAEVHASIPIHGETTMEALVAASVRERRFVLVLLGGFAALALSLASAGIFGLMAFVTAGRAKEYGIRRALGAERAELLTLVLRRGLALAGAGILIGVATAVPAAGLVEGLLFEVAPLDLRVFGLAGLTLAAAGAAAVLVPALRAARASPVEVLRVE